MFGNKGQATLIDILIIGLFISMLLVMGYYSGINFIQAELSREEILYTDTMLTSLLSYNNETYGGDQGIYDNKHNLSISEALDLYYCGDGKIKQYHLNHSIAVFLNKTVKPDYNYIFYTAYTSDDMTEGKGIHVWKGQKDVCAKYLPVKTIDLKTSCGKTLDASPTLLIWPEWKKIPTSEDCD